MMENEYGESGQFYIFTSLKHLMIPLKCNFSGLQFSSHITDTDSMWGRAAPIFESGNIDKQYRLLFFALHV